MKIEDIEHLARLARIDLSDEEKQSLLKDVESILAFVGTIKEVEVDTSAEARVGSVYNVLREDGEPHERGVYTDELLTAAPDTERGYVKVQRIL